MCGSAPFGLNWKLIRNCKILMLIENTQKKVTLEHGHRPFIIMTAIKVFVCLCVGRWGGIVQTGPLSKKWIFTETQMFKMSSSFHMFLNAGRIPD